MPALHLLPIGLVDPDLLQRLALELRRRLAAPVVVEGATTAPAHWRKAADFDAPAILQDLVAAPPEDGGWRLALVDGNLVAPGVSSSRGLATIGGCCAIVALAPRSRALASGLQDNFQHHLASAVHEVGHLAGLDHCPDPRCVMHFNAEAASGGSATELCAACQRRMD